MKVIPLQTFHGATDLRGTHARDYLQGETYEIDERLALDFIDAALVTLPEEEINEPDAQLAAKAEQANPDVKEAGKKGGRGKGNGIASTAGQPVRGDASEDSK